MIYFVWAIFLLFQNASFTMVSRARNSGSDLYHGIAAVFSNGIWFITFAFTFEILDRIWEGVRSGSWWFAIGIGLLYITMTVTGSVLSAKFLRRFVERGKRKVGHYSKGEGDK